MKHDHSHGMGKHMLLMLVCCLVPIGLVIAVSTFGLSLGPLQPLVPYVAALMCPLMMGLMMYGMMRGQGDEHSHHHVDVPRAQPTRQISETAVETAAVASQDKCH